MDVTLEISFYPLQNDYETPVTEFIGKLSEYENIQITTGTMSSLITGDYDLIMLALNDCIKPFLEKYPSVFRFSISTACKSCVSQ